MLPPNNKPPKKPRHRPKHGPEYKIQERLVSFLEARGWLVERMIGNAYQMGIPDLYCHHPQYEYRWIDVKVEGKYSFTSAQREKWPLWEEKGVQIWILTEANQEQYDRLFKPANWRDYWKAEWDTQESVDELMTLIEEGGWDIYEA